MDKNNFLYIKPPLSLEPRSCIRPLIFETGLESWPYSMCGTGFFALSDDKVFFVTASHNILKGQQDLLHVSVSQEGTRTIKLKNFYRASLDFVFFSIEEDSSVDLDEIRSSAVQLLRLTSLEDFFEKWQKAGIDYTGIPFCAIGYPTETDKSYIDYESCHIKAAIHSIILKYKGRSIVSGCYEVSTNESEIKVLNGMSGSPVFMKIKNEGYILIGILIRASNGIGHFLSSLFLQQGIRRAILDSE